MVEIGGVALELDHVPSPHGAPTLVFLHEALGSLAQWKDFPDRLASACGLGWMGYSRQGHGGSAPLDAPRDFDYLDHEAIEALLDPTAYTGLCAEMARDAAQRARATAAEISRDRGSPR